jgi:hypothetical protein
MKLDNIYCRGRSDRHQKGKLPVNGRRNGRPSHMYHSSYHECDEIGQIFENHILSSEGLVSLSWLAGSWLSCWQWLEKGSDGWLILQFHDTCRKYLSCPCLDTANVFAVLDTAKSDDGAGSRECQDEDNRSVRGFPIML